MKARNSIRKRKIIDQGDGTFEVSFDPKEVTRAAAAVQKTMIEIDVNVLDAFAALSCLAIQAAHGHMIPKKVFLEKMDSWWDQIRETMKEGETNE